MNILPAIHAQSASNPQDTPAASAAPSSQGLSNMFLQLLMAQLKNQSPLNPMDPTQFVTQLAQFSELSEVTQISQTLSQLIPANTGSSQAQVHLHANTSSGAADSGVPSSDPLGAAAVSAAQAIRRSSSLDPNSNPTIQGVF